MEDKKSEKKLKKIEKKIKIVKSAKIIIPRKYEHIEINVKFTY